MTTPPTANDATLAALIDTLAAGHSGAPPATPGATPGAMIAAAAGQSVPATAAPTAAPRQGLRSAPQSQRLASNTAYVRAAQFFVQAVRAHFCAKKGTRISNARQAAQTRFLRHLAVGKPIEIIATPLTTANGTVLGPVRCARCITTRGPGGRTLPRPRGGLYPTTPLIGWGSELAATPGATIIWQASGVVVVPRDPQGRTVRLCPLCQDCAEEVRFEADLLRTRLAGTGQNEPTGVGTGGQGDTSA